MRADPTDAIVLFLVLFIALTGFIALLTRLARGSKPEPTPADSPRDLTLRARSRLAALVAEFGGTVDGLMARLQRDGFKAKVTVEGGGEEPTWTSLELAGSLAPVGLSVEATISGGDIETGDADFDGVARVKGNGAMAVAVLTPKARRVAARALLAGLVVEAHRVEATIRMRVHGDDVSLMRPHLETALELARHLRRPTDLEATLMARLNDEPTPAGRFFIALQAPPTLAEDPARLTALCAHPDPEVRLALAVRLGRPELWATLPEASLQALLSAPRPWIRHEAIKALGRLGTVDSVPRLESVKLEGKDDKVLATDAILSIQARATGSRGDLALAAAGGGLSLDPLEAQP